MATAETTYVEPSALARLYLHQQGSREMAAWAARAQAPLAVTHHGQTEVVNAICRAAFVRDIGREKMLEVLNHFDNDFTNGRLQLADILWRSALDRAAELSRQFTPALGTRSLDVIHVACALELRRRNFLTFDVKQQELAVATGLKAVRLT